MFHLDPGLEEVGEAVGQAEESRSDGLAARGSGPLARGVVGPEGDDLFHVADGQALGDDPDGQAFLRFRVLQAEQGPGVTGTEHARGDPLLHGRRQVQQAQGIADVRPGAADLLRELLMGGAEVVEQLLVGRGLLERVELLPVQVLDQGVPEQIVVLSLLHDGGDLGQPGPLGGTPAALAHDELIPAGPGRADHHRLEQADLPDRLREFLE